MQKQQSYQLRLNDQLWKMIEDIQQHEHFPNDCSFPHSFDILFDNLINKSIAYQDNRFLHFLEEWLFRDWMISFLKKKGLRYRYAILISAFIFAILHFDWWLFPYLVNGIIYGIIKVKSKNGYTSMIVHSAYNTLVLLPLLF